MNPIARSLSLPLALAFVLVVAAFVASTAITERYESDLGVAAFAIQANAAPSIQHLSAARAELHRLRALVLKAVIQDGSETEADLREAARARADVDQEIGAYLQLPYFPGERDLWQQTAAQIPALNASFNRLLRALRAGEAAEARTEASRFDRIAEAIGGTLEHSTRFNVDRADELARLIARTHARAARLAFALDAIGVVLSMAVALFVLRLVRAHTRLVETHDRFMERKADELDQFASRVAHDVLNPLTVAGLALDSAERALAGDPSKLRMMRRGRSSLAQARTIVDGLLDFARAGAGPEPGARSDVETVVASVIGGLRLKAEEARVEVTARQPEPLAAACSPGALTSILSNLLGNAIKYMGDSAARRIEIEVKSAGDALTFEVRDTGPGLPPDLGDDAFEPYVRGRGPGQPGIGLGLATVRRIVEGHGGRVSVSSSPRGGASFRFTLPSAQGDAAAPHESPAERNLAGAPKEPAPGDRLELSRA